MILDQINIEYYRIRPQLPEVNDMGQCLTVVLMKTTESSEKDQALLIKMLGAVKRSMEETMIITIADEDLGHGISGVFDSSQIKQILVFGISPIDIGLNISVRLYHLLNIGDKRIIFSHGLPTITQKPEYKKPLWEALQQAF